MDKTQANAIASRMRELLAPLEREFGVTVKVGGGTYDPAGLLKPRVEIASAGTSKEAIAFKREAIFYGLDEQHLGAKIQLNGVSYEVAGLRPRAGKKPLVLRRESDGAELVGPLSDRVIAIIKEAVK